LVLLIALPCNVPLHGKLVSYGCDTFEQFWVCLNYIWIWLFDCNCFFGDVGIPRLVSWIECEFYPGSSVYHVVSWAKHLFSGPSMIYFRALVHFRVVSWNGFFWWEICFLCMWDIWTDLGLLAPPYASVFFLQIYLCLNYTWVWLFDHYCFSMNATIYVWCLVKLLDLFNHIFENRGRFTTIYR